MDSSVRGISQARILEWVAISIPRESSCPGIETVSPELAGGFFTYEPPGKAHLSVNTIKTPASPRSLYVGWRVVSTQKKVSLPVYLNPATLMRGSHRARI